MARCFMSSEYSYIVYFMLLNAHGGYISLFSFRKDGFVQFAKGYSLTDFIICPGKDVILKDLCLLHSPLQLDLEFLKSNAT